MKILLLLLAVPLGALDLAGLQAAVKAGPPVVVIPAGTYIGQLVVDRSVVLKAEPGARLVRGPGTQGPTLWIRSPGVSVEGLQVWGSGEGTRLDHTAVYASGDGLRLTRLTIRDAWAGLWIDQSKNAVVEDLLVVGFSEFPFWERGEAVRVTNSSQTTLNRLELSFASDGLAVETSGDTAATDVSVTDARYGVHLMFAPRGTVTRATTRRAVAGLMIMESSDWSVSRSAFTDGNRFGSAGVRQIRTQRVAITDSLIARQASGIELIDAHDARLTSNRIESNAVAWTWGGDNTGTVISANVHRGNLVDASGSEADEAALEGGDAHDHGPQTPAKTAPTGLKTAPVFDGNVWDAWHGFDLDHDGRGDTPYLFDRAASLRAASRPWAGFFLGSPWSVLSQSLPGGEVLDPRPRLY